MAIAVRGFVFRSICDFVICNAKKYEVNADSFTTRNRSLTDITMERYRELSNQTWKKLGERMSLLIALASAIVSAVVSAPASAAAIDNLQPGHWYRVPNSKMEQVAPPVIPPGSVGVRGVMDAWNGGAYDSIRDRLIVWGGGHNDYSGNELYAFDVNSERWIRLTDPSDPVEPEVLYYPDGRPTSRHTYSSLVFAPNVDRFFSMGTGAAYGPTGYKNGKNIDAFDFNTNTWSTNVGTIPDTGNSLSVVAAYDPVTGYIWTNSTLNGGRLVKYDPVTRTSTAHAYKSMEYYGTAAIDSKRHIMVSIGGYGGQRQFLVWDLNNPDNPPTSPSTSGPNFLESAQAPGFDYDPVSDRFVAWDGGTSVYLLDPDTWTWTRVDAASTNTVTPTSPEPRGTYGRFRYIPSKNAFIVVNRTSDDVYYYKLTAGAGSSVSAPAPVASPAAVIDAFSASASTVTSGASVTLTWASTNADSCTAGGAWSGDLPTSGSRTINNVTSDGTYTLSCTGVGGTDSKSLVITVVQPTSGNITTFQVTNRSGNAQTDVPVTFGQVFKAGDVPAGSGLLASLPDGTPVPLQLDVKATHADGSLRHALLTVRVPALAANETRTIVLSTGSPSSGGTAVSVADVLSTGFDATVTVQDGSATYLASAASLLQLASARVWISGPEVTEWIVGGPLKTSSGTAHSHLATYFHVRAYADGRVRVDVSLENGWLQVGGPGTLNPTVTIKVGGNTVWGPAPQVMYHHTRWHQVYWWKSSGTADPAVTVRHDVEYLQGTGAVPNYADGLAPTDATLNALNQTNIPMDNGQHTDDQGSAGYQPAIGILPLWDALYAVSGDYRAAASVLANASGGGAYSMHYRDETTGRPLAFSRYPALSEQNNSLPATSGGNPLRHEFNHEPSIGFMAYLISGDYYYLEEMQFWTTWNYLWTSPDYGRQGSKGIFGSEVRGQAWALRTLGQAAYITPDNDPLKNEFENSLAANLSYIESVYSANPSANNLGAIQSYDGYTQFKPWMDDFYTMSMGYLVDLGYSQAILTRDWKAKNPLGRMGTTDYCYIKAGAYVLTVGTSNSNWFPDFATLYQQNFGANTSCPEGALMDGYPTEPTGYVANLRPALATAVDAGLPGAVTAWNRMINSQAQPDFSQNPIWAINPRTLSGTTGGSSSSTGSSGGGTSTGSTGSTGGSTTPPATPAPVVSLSASLTSVQSGGSTTLSWSASNATACTASGGWSGSKATSGSLTLSNLVATDAYNLSCVGDGGSDTASVTVYVSSAAGSSTPDLPIASFSGDADGADPSGWFDTGANNAMSNDETLFKVFSVGGNKAFGTSYTANSNIHSHYVGAGSAGWTNYRYTGRMRISGSRDGIGVTFFSDYPNSDAYYRLRSESGSSFHIAPHGTGIECTGDIDTGVAPAPNTWYRFKVEVEDTGAATDVRARVWAEGGSEPATWQVSCSDSGTRRVAGTVGLWAVVGSVDTGTKYWDDLFVEPLAATGGGNSGSSGGSSTTTPTAPVPTMSFSATPTVVESGANVTLSWSSTNATGCIASSGWSGSKAVSGSQSVGPVNADSVFALTCSGDGGATTRLISVSVQAAPAAASNGDSDGDGLDDSWELQYFGTLARSGAGDFDNDGLSDQLEFSLNVDPTNPDTDNDGMTDGEEYAAGGNPAVADALLAAPSIRVDSVLSLSRPVIGALLAGGQVQTAAAGNGGDVPVAIRWQLSSASDFSRLLLDRETDIVDAIDLPAGLLKSNTQYWVRAAVRDGQGRKSAWSGAASFTTEASNALDGDNDGIYDQFQVTGFVDTNENGVDDADESICNLRDARTGSVAGFKASEGVIRCVSSITLDTVSLADASVADSVRSRMSRGMFYFVIEGLPVDPAFPATVAVTVHLPRGSEAYDGWYKYDDTADSLTDFSDNVLFEGNKATIILTDGGAGDADGVVNGIIVDPSGPVVAAAGGSTVTADSSASGGGGGAMQLVPLWFLVLLTLMRSRRVRAGRIA